MLTTLFIAFLLLLLLGLPVAIALGVSSLIALFFGSPIPFLILPQKLYNGINGFPFMAIPLFLLAGNIMAQAKISEKLIGLASLLVGRYPGGLAHIATGGSAMFGAISGSAPATTAAVGTIMIPSMKKKGYSGSYAAAVVASSGALGLIIPPSLTMVIFGVISGSSIGDLFINGIIPGILIAVSLMLLNYIMAKKRNFPKEERVSRDEALLIIKDSLFALCMPLIILGGIYSGAFTATESAAIACLYGTLVGLFIYKTLTLKMLFSIFKDTCENAALVMFLMGTANLFGFIITAEQLPQQLAAMILDFTDNKYVFLILIMFVLLILGTFMDNVGALVLFVPTMTTIVNQLQIDMVYFGLFTVITLSVGQFTPPVGLNLFISCNISQEKIENVVKEIIPYFLVYVSMILLFIFVPQLLMMF